ncbi:transglutaminase domain-containing protein [Candidatus Woesearchaeota archaeon]|nr:transglutaminase domain-containing protein [Candidatus Woesearchaeota archaeon]
MKQILMLLLLLPCVSATLYDRDSLQLNLTLSAEIDIDGSPKELRAFLYDIPRATSTQAINAQTSTPGTIGNQSVEFVWTSPRNKVRYSLSSSIKTKFDIPKVKPSQLRVSTDHQELTQPSKHIDSDNLLIKAKAKEIVGDEQDTMVALFKLGTWVEENIQYDLSSLTEQVTQSSSWALEHKTGVCDEITSLFIAFARSMGIPARYVSGISYTELEEFGTNWLRHGWAEVYVDGKWVPFDIVYGQMGYVDVTHLKLSDALDSKHTSQAFFLEGDGNFVSKPLIINVTVTDEGKPLVPVLTMEPSIDTAHPTTLSVALENEQDYYIITTLYLAVPPEVGIEKDTIHVLMRPKEKKTISFEIIIPEQKKGSLQTFQADIYNERNEKKSILLTPSDESSVPRVQTNEETSVLSNLWTFVKRFFASLVG